jgi:hypothetical protein
LVPSSADLHISRRETPMVRMLVPIMLTFPILTKPAKNMCKPCRKLALLRGQSRGLHQRLRIIQKLRYGSSGAMIP